MSIGAVILAAGESRRMGFSKLLLSHRGKSLLARAVSTAKKVCDEVWVVVGAYSRVYSAEVASTGVQVVLNRDWQEGLSSSLRRGISALPPGFDVAVILLADQPFVDREHLEALLKCHLYGRRDLVLSRYETTLGAPALIARSLFSHLLTLRGNIGVRALVGSARSVGEVPLKTSQDVDTPEDAKIWLEP